MACVGNDDDLREVTLGDNGAFAGMRKGAVLRRSHHRLGRDRPRASRRGEAARLRVHRRAGVRRPGRRRERRPHRHVRRRCRAVRARREGHRRLCPRLQPDGRARLGPARQDGQPDLHRRPGPGARRGPAFRQMRRPRYREADRDHLQGRRAVLADGEPLQDHGRQASSISASRSTGCARTSASASPKRAATAPTCR